MSELAAGPGRESQGVIRDVAVLDLTASSSPDELRHITRIEDVAVILIRASAASALLHVDLTDVASVVTVPDEGRARVHTGSLVLTGEAFAEEAIRGDVLVVTGSLTVTSPVGEVAYDGIIVTGSVLAPEGSETTLGTAITRLTGSFSTYPYREGQRIEHRSGSVDLRGAALANPHGSPDDVLLVSGSLTVTGEAGEIGYARIVVAGSVVAPASMQDALEPYLVASSTVWYAQPPKVLKGSQTLGRAFFQLLDEPITLVLLGSTQIDADVTLDDVAPKIGAAYVHGSLHGPREVIAVFQARGEVHGSVHPLDEPDA